jgi:hypothetical protein
MSNIPKPTNKQVEPAKQAASKLGEYVVTDDIAEGTFGKVKSEFLRL